MFSESELKERISRMSDDELREMLTVNSTDYREDALYLARKEAMARRIDLTLPLPGASDESVAQEGLPADSQPSSDVCFICGGRLRYGTLVAEKELTIVFADNKEERFVRVGACRKCGQISLSVDFETEIQP